MLYKKTKIAILVFTIFFIGFISLRYTKAQNNLDDKIQTGDYIDSVYEDSNEENFIQEKEHINHDIVEENFIQIKDKKEEVSRSIDSRRNNSISKIVEKAYDELGKPYSYGKTGPSSYDCSGFTSYIYSNSLDIELNRTSKQQSENGYLVEKKDLIPGDLVFFNTSGKDISHVGIYIGNGEMIHASSKSKKIIIAKIDSDYFKSRYVTARRIIR